MGFLYLLFGRIIDRRIQEYQNDLITKHCEEVQNIYRQMRGWRHDYHNHIQTMKAHLVLEQTEELKEYLNHLDKDLTVIDRVVKTGNVMVDAMLNSKLSLIQTRKIAVNVKAVVPASLAIAEVDLCVIIGNLLDNAMEAALKLQKEEERFIRVFIGVLKGQLYLAVTNSSGGETKKTGRRYLSTKDSKGHGFGLMRIDNIVNKYGGYLNRQNEEGVFVTEVMLPL